MILPVDDLNHVLMNMDSWEKLRGKRVFLTGASGFVGTWLTETFWFANDALDLRSHLIRVGRDELPEGAFDFGFHAAKADDFWADIVGTKRILDFAAERGASRLLYTSSGAVYGRLLAEMIPVSEEFAGAPYTHDAASGYAQAKRASEFLFAEYARRFGFAAVIARLFAFSGPLLPLNANFALGNFVRDVMSGGPVAIKGDGISVRSYLYAADLAVWLWKLLLDGESARPYNVGSPDAVTIHDLATLVVSVLKPGIPIVALGGRGDAGFYVPDVRRVCNEFGLRPLVPLEDGLRRMRDWHLRNEMPASY